MKTTEEFKTTKRTASTHGTSTRTQADKDYIKSFAKDGVVSFDDYLTALTNILNR